MKSTLLMAAITCISLHVYPQSNNYLTVKNVNGPVLGYSPASGIKILTVDGLKFKDLNKNGRLDKYEDWREPVDVRAHDLARRMSTEQIAGLMLYSAHQSIPSPASGFGAATYNGLPFAESGAQPWALTDQQKKCFREDNLRHVLVMNVESPEIAARWNNEMQAYLEGIGLGIPGNSSSDPRHATTTNAEFNAKGGNISLWPRELGLAATFDPSLVEGFGRIAAAEYRALGICTALSPQVDVATEPRWFRLGMTFGENPQLTADMGRAYIDGFQTSTGDAETADGWGFQSVNAMVKHWPGGGPEEGGRDAHWAFGKFAVYPGNNLEAHLKPFTEGAFKLHGKTGEASAVMPYYTISYNQAKDGTNYGNGFSKYLITDLLRNRYHYDGVVCTDWLITGNEAPTPGGFAGKCWGTEAMTVAQRHYMVLKAGVDQFGGNNDKEPVLEAYRMGVKEFGRNYMRKRFETSAVRLLRNIFRVGLFENPYLDPEESARIVGNPAFMQAGYEAQLKSTVLLKNKGNVLPVRERKTVYIPKTYTPPTKDWWNKWAPATFESPVKETIVQKYFDVTDDPDKADFALVFMRNPKSMNGGYDTADRAEGGNGYVPISLQYRPYTAVEARAQSIAAGDPVVDPEITNRSYRDKTTRTLNENDLDVLLTTRQMMGNKPVIAVVDLSNPMVFKEFEPQTDAILISFGSSAQSILDIVSGRFEPQGLLPVQMPADMNTVEEQMEDVPHDMQCHKDTEGHTYDFAFGMNWKGVISDTRTQQYGYHNN